VLNDSLRGKTWVVGERLTIADFSIAGFVPLAECTALHVEKFPEILRWYRGVAALPAGRAALTDKDAALPLGGPPLGLRFTSDDGARPERTLGATTGSRSNVVNNGS
jgi:hypothetical protein